MIALLSILVWAAAGTGGIGDAEDSDLGGMGSNIGGAAVAGRLWLVDSGATAATILATFFWLLIVGLTGKVFE